MLHCSSHPQGYCIRSIPVSFCSWPLLSKPGYQPFLYIQSLPLLPKHGLNKEKRWGRGRRGERVDLPTRKVEAADIGHYFRPSSPQVPLFPTSSFSTPLLALSQNNGTTYPVLLIQYMTWFWSISSPFCPLPLPSSYGLVTKAQDNIFSIINTIHNLI